jgi:uncharacterized protein (DUF433 family)
MPTLTENGPSGSDVLGQGLYSVADMSRLLAAYGVRANEKTVGTWAQKGLVQHRRGAPEYSFFDLISMLVVASLRESGVSLQQVRRAEAHLSNELRVERPFATRRIYTDGVDVLYHANPAIAQQLTAANRAGQEVFEPVLRDRLHAVEYQNELAAWWQVAEGIRVDPRIQYGDPCIAGRGLRTSRIGAMVRAGESLTSIAHWYDLSLEDVQRALRFERALTRR